MSQLNLKTHITPINTWSDIYNRKASQHELFLLQDQHTFMNRTINHPIGVVIDIHDFLSPMQESPLGVVEDLIYHLFQMASIKRDIDYRLSENMALVYEYHYDEAFSDAIPNDQGYRHHVANIQKHCMCVELTVHHIVRCLSLLGMYVDDLYFPYEFYSMMTDRRSAVFKKMEFPFSL